jgi:hypothetical protein
MFIDRTSASTRSSCNFFLNRTLKVWDFREGGEDLGELLTEKLCDKTTACKLVFFTGASEPDKGANDTYNVK